MLGKEWQVVAESDECVLVTIGEDVDLHICSHTEKPMFAQLGNSVKYVKGSGKSMY